MANLEDTEALDLRIRRTPFGWMLQQFESQNNVLHHTRDGDDSYRVLEIIQELMERQFGDDTEDKLAPSITLTGEETWLLCKTLRLDLIKFLREFEHEVAGPGNEGSYRTSVNLRERLEKLG